MLFRRSLNKWMLAAITGLCAWTQGYGDQNVGAPETYVSGWLPNQIPIFPQLKADPRQPRFSIGYRWHDNAINSCLAAANMGGDIPLWRSLDLWGFDQLQIGLQGAVWALFDMNSHGLDLINSDWYAGLPIYASKGEWKMRLRAYHISSHLGDEYIMRNHLTSRKNPSYEVLDYTAYHPVLPHLNLYGTIGRVMHSHSSYPIHPMYFEFGSEYFWGDLSFSWLPLKAQPYAAIHVRCWELHGFEPSYNAVLGLAWSDKKNPVHHFNTSLEYYRGHSLEGEFGKRRADYMSVQLTYAP